MADPLTDAGAGALTAPRPPAFDFVVEAGKVAEFARATGADPASAADLAPVTFPAASALWMKPENSAWHGIDRDYRHVLHGEQRFDYHDGPLPVGIVLRARQRFGRTFEKTGRRGVMTFTEVVTRFWTTDEAEPLAEMTSLSITLPSPAGERTEPRGEGGSASVDAPARPQTAVASSLVSDETPPLTITDFVKYQGASGDFNPIHHDADFARAAGYPSPFAVGMLTAGLAAARIAKVRDVQRLRTFRARWQSQAWPGDRLRFVIGPRDTATDAVDATVTRAGGDVHMLAWADFA
ncbi:FAS1-like dehydratase domain-containing protein [Microbacterium sp. CPCC 204701]|uniref:FAS1-like dehydratase domain-containing protein n=1 Tax=Microbacterium sp. CPCC 204701 TaxID=2493084 RepID=UPI000FDB7862|nr:MaoC family dehydratase N-terminal domain-containing protein [Microbacterium sp. CPCC 204701]